MLSHTIPETSTMLTYCLHISEIFTLIMRLLHQFQNIYPNTINDSQLCVHLNIDIIVITECCIVLNHRS